MRVLVITLALTSCSFPEPTRAPDATGVEPDAPPETPGADDFSGTISAGGGVLQTGTIAVIDDGLESAEPACAEQICTTGGISP